MLQGNPIFRMIWVKSLNIHPLVALISAKMVGNSIHNSPSLMLGEKKDYRPKLLLQSPILEKGTISELQTGETAIPPLLLATCTDLAWNVSIFSGDTQTARD